MYSVSTAPSRPATEGEVDNFWRNVERGPSCWAWKGARTQKGYGDTHGYGFEERRAHRVAYSAVHGSIPDGLCVLHSCDNRLCVRPDHLRIGTNSDNVADRSARGRHASTKKTTCPAGHPYDYENTVVRSDGKRRCRACRNARMRVYMRRRRGGA